MVGKEKSEAVKQSQIRQQIHAKVFWERLILNE
jgi:hypothetical protein